MQELLELEDATFERNRENERQGETNEINYNSRFTNPIEGEQLFYGQDEILIRNKLSLEPTYKEKVKKYFENKK